MLFRSASGMVAQQTNVDTISNNLANINTVGYKKESAEFKTLLYQTMQQKSTDNEGNAKPVSAQVGLGVRTGGITSIFDQGDLIATGNSTDLAIEGKGFFRVMLSDGTYGYTRSGGFVASIFEDGVALSDSDGNPLVDVDGNPLVIYASYDISKLSIDALGNIGFPDETNNTMNMGLQLSIVQCNNPSGLEKLGNSIYRETAASGEPRLESEDASLRTSKVVQGYLENANVQAVEEMVNLIVAQRAYEMNSKIITASDTMMQQANNLRAIISRTLSNISFSLFLSDIVS